MGVLLEQHLITTCTRTSTDFVNFPTVGMGQCNHEAVLSSLLQVWKQQEDSAMILANNIEGGKTKRKDKGKTPKKKKKNTCNKKEKHRITDNRG